MLKVAAALVIFMMWPHSASSNPSSEWIYITSSYDDDMYFVHEPSMIKEKNRFEFWQLINYANIQKNAIGITYFSTKSLSIIDCPKRTSILKELVFYSETDGKGKVADRATPKSESEGKSAIMPGSVGESVFHAVCGKKTTKTNSQTKPSVEEQVAQAKNRNHYITHWEANDPGAWDEALRQDEILRNNPKWIEKSYDARFKEVVRRVRAIMPEATTPSSELPGYVEFHGELDKPSQK
ncbi:hypothetical protein SAMN05216428_102335 [Nitrosospira sp. Nsp11]|nr:hypothetical protein SAMN05216428_102335 [Nitrosospira sp. Nsp11]